MQPTSINITDSQPQKAIPGGDRINANELFELRKWADKFGVTAVRLKAAINVVGNSSQKVEAYLNRSK